MRLPASFALPLTLLSLAACGDRGDPPADPANGMAQAPIPTASRESADNSARPVDPPAQPVPSAPVATEEPAGLIPAAMRGRWTGLADDCSDDASEMALTVTPDRLLFHESEGVARAVDPVDGGVAVQADFTGEGQSWTRQIMLRPSADGRRLTVVNDGMDVIRKRCGAD